MYSVSRFILPVLASTLLGGSLVAATTEAPPEYKAADANFYLKADVLKADPAANILTSGFTHTGDSYFLPARKHPAKTIYIEVTNDWLEPLTPPDMSPLVIAPDAMQIREPQGDVQVALASAPATFVPATEGMTIDNGSVVKTGANGSAAVLFGGVNSARLAPGSQAAVQQTVTPQLRTTEIDLHSGTVFSKVGLRPGEKQDFQVHTPMGVAAARGTDFVTVALPSRTDVWIAQGTVQLSSPSGKPVGTVSSEGTGTLKIMRNPPSTGHDAMIADAETMTAAMNFIPMANQKLKGLHDRVASGTKMTANEEAYVNRIKKVPALIKLSLVEPAPVAAPVLTPKVPAAPKPAPAPKAIPAVKVVKNKTLPEPKPAVAADTSVSATTVMKPAPMVKAGAPIMALRGQDDLDTSSAKASKPDSDAPIVRGPGATVP